MGPHPWSPTRGPRIHDLPIVLPHKLDFIALAYDRCPEYRRARNDFRMARSNADALQRWQLRSRNCAGDGVQPVAPRPTSTRLFGEKDIGLIPEVTDALRTAYRWHAMAPSIESPGGQLMRARSQTSLELSLDKYGTRRKW